VGHVDHALRIVADRKIRKGLVFDASKLNSERVLVVWLSPNHWADGFRYGTVAFTFDFADLVRDKKYYWVEAMTDYRPAACRILVTGEDHSGKLKVYDPTKRDGPWWYDRANDTHYYNGKFCLEFMVEADLSIDHASKVDFVTHHPNMCSVRRTSPRSCPEHGLREGKGGALFLATAAARNVDLSPLSKTLIEEEGKLSFTVKNALGWLILRFGSLAFTGEVRAGSDTGKAIARALLNAIAIGERSEAELMAALFRSEHSLMRAVTSVIAETLDWDDTDAVLKALDS